MMLYRLLAALGVIISAYAAPASAQTQYGLPELGIVNGIGSVPRVGAPTCRDVVIRDRSNIQVPIGCVNDALHSWNFSQIIIGGPQSAVGQLGQITAPYTTGMLNTNTDTLRVVVGTPPGITPANGLPINWEFPYEVGGINFSTAAVTGVVVIPAGSYTGQTAGWPDFGTQGIALTYNPNKSAVALFGYAGIGVTNGAAWGQNGVVVNCELGKSTCVDGGGLDANLFGGEDDVNIFLKAGGVAPSGGIVGRAIVLGASAAALTNLSSSGLYINAAGTGRWGNAITTTNGAAAVGASWGAQAKTGPADSQILFLNSLSAGGATQSATIKLDAAQIFTLSAPGGSFNVQTAFPQLFFTNSKPGAPVGFTVANSSNAASSQSSIAWTTGTVGSSASGVLTDSGTFNITTGSAINQIFMQAGGGSPSIALASPVFVTAMVGSGYVKGSNATVLSAVSTIPTTDLSGTLQAAQFPALTGDVTTTAGSLATAIGASRVTNAMLAGSIAASKLVGTDIATVGTLTAGATGTGFTIALGTSTVTGTLPTANTAALTGDVTKTAGTNPTVLATAQPAVHTWALAQTFTVAPVFTDASGTRTALGLGTAAVVNTGTSGATIPLLNGANAFSALNTFSAGLSVPVSAATAPTIDASGQTGINVTNGGSTAIAFDNMGMVIVTDLSTGHTAIYLMLAGAANLVAMDSNWTTGGSPGAGFSSLAWNGSAFAIFNNTGTSHGYKVINFRTH